ncbi:hypothetical protein HN747_02075 [archaeon]|nr:hypothetical protein [archaeon]
MKKIHLNALDVDLSVPDSVHYRDDGFVDNIHAHHNFLKWKHTGNINDLFNPAGDDPGQKGAMGYVPYGQEHHFMVCYLHNSNPYTEILVRGHEETHFAHAIKCLDQLSNYMKFRLGIEIDIKKRFLVLIAVKKEKKLQLTLGPFLLHIKCSDQMQLEICQRVGRSNICT